jgi:hypothetical protein
MSVGDAIAAIERAQTMAAKNEGSNIKGYIKERANDVLIELSVEFGLAIYSIAELQLLDVRKEVGEKVLIAVDELNRYCKAVAEAGRG